MSGTITSKIKKILEQIEELEREEKALYKQLDKIETKRQKLQEKLQEYVDKINNAKAKQENENQ